MTRVVWLRRVGDSRMRMRAEGHAGAAACGQDVVCAAVSTAMEMLETNLLVFGCRCGGRRGAALHEVDGQGVPGVQADGRDSLFFEGIGVPVPGICEFYRKNFGK